jgi:uncharacterized protein YegJ (DUF2314 family)
MKLTDAVERNEAHPDTFEIPDTESRTSVPFGHYVKIGFDNRERMWVKVTEKHGDLCVGTLANDPVAVNLNFGDRVEFTERNVMDICPPRNAL